MPATESNNKLIVWDPNADDGYKVNPNYDFQRDVIAKGTLPAGSPAPNLSRPFLGGITLINTPQFPGRGNTVTHYRNFAPRLGLAYEFIPKTVLRMGFAIMYPGTAPNFVNPWFKSTGTAQITPDNGQTITASLSNPFPNNLGVTVGANDLASFKAAYKGLGTSPIMYGAMPEYEINYNVTLQRTVKNQWLFEAGLIGNRGIHMPVSQPYLNTLDPQYLSLGALLDKQVANPFYGTGLPEHGVDLTKPTIPYKQLLMTYPHLFNMTPYGVTYGSSKYLAGAFKVERRFSRGLSLLATYTVSKVMSNMNALPQDGRTLSDIWALSQNDIPQRLLLTYLYDLPFGKGKLVLGDPRNLGWKVLDRVVGGWKVAGYTQLASGVPLIIRQRDGFPGGLGYSGPRPTLLSNNYDPGVDVRDAVGLLGQAKTPYINKSAFGVTSRYAFGTTPILLPNFRGPRYNQTDLAIMKEFQFAEATKLQVRLESQNFFNHPVFSSPDTNIQSATFGLITGTSNVPRQMQFGARFVF